MSPESLVLVVDERIISGLAGFGAGVGAGVVATDGGDAVAIGERVAVAVGGVDDGVAGGGDAGVGEHADNRRPMTRTSIADKEYKLRLVR